jgi:FkbM family methyltransferase
LFSDSVGNKGKVYAFEPVPYLFNILRFHCSLFNLKNVLAENKAVSEHEGYLKFILSEGNVQDNTLVYNKNNRINYINHLKLLLEKYRNSFCDIILVKK